MTETFLAILTGAGLAGAAGHRAFVPAFVLGLLHHLAAWQATDAAPFFALGDGFLWLAHPGVLLCLGTLTLLEFTAEANPDVPELTEWALRAPRMLSGFIVVAATVGSVDASLVTMAGSGVLGAGTALFVERLRSSVKRTVDGALGPATDGVSTRTLAAAETGWSLGVTLVAILLPVLVLLAAFVLFLAWRGGAAMLRRSQVPCAACGEPCHPNATACPHCRASLALPS